MASGTTADAGIAAANVRTRFLTVPRQRALSALVLVAALLFPIVNGNDANIDAMANAFAFATLALGLNIVVGFAGLLDLGYAAFFAIGAYTYGILSSWQIHPPWSGFWVPFAWLDLVQKASLGDATVVHFTVSFWLALALSAVIAAFFGVLFGAPTLRLRGDYLAIVTLGFGEIVPIIARNWTWLTNGAAGLNGAAPPRLFGWSFGIWAEPYYYVVLALVVLLMFVSISLRDSRIGRAWMALRDDEVAASAMGIDLVRYKLLAFATGAGFAGMTGCFYIAKLQSATPDMFMFPVSVMILVMVVLGGMGSVWGVVVAAMILQLLQSWFLPDLSGWISAFGQWTGIGFLQNVHLEQATELIFGIILVAMMLFRREGLIPATRKQAALSFDQQNAQVGQSSGFMLSGIGAGTSSAVAALEIKGVTVRFGGLVALKSVDITVPAGGVVAVIGPNGSGKSTLFNVITGLTRAELGSIQLYGEEILGLKPHAIAAKGVARTFQNLRLFTNLTVMENVLIGQHSRLRTGPFGAVLHLPGAKAEEKRARERVLEIIANFGNRLVPRTAQNVSALSYANRRRVEVSRALASNPRILLLDEPTAGMNPAETLELAEQIKALHKLGLTIIVIEHKLDVVVRLADTVVVLDHGEKIAEGRPEEVRRNEEVLRAYLGRNAQAGSAGIAA
ncbi:MAG TPA: branched-chain amino acid ABC transporter ATP-binding protein/permease [Acetobacteraceae bacterium]|nr:branched-chain amino acid ABC transporter ATP-binding protein/permease [Acetobacteraceae bacterium]